MDLYLLNKRAQFGKFGWNRGFCVGMLTSCTL